MVLRRFTPFGTSTNTPKRSQSLPMDLTSLCTMINTLRFALCPSSCQIVPICSVSILAVSDLRNIKTTLLVSLLANSSTLQIASPLSALPSATSPRSRGTLNNLKRQILLSLGRTWQNACSNTVSYWNVTPLWGKTFWTEWKSERTKLQSKYLHHRLQSINLLRGARQRQT